MTEDNLVDPTFDGSNDYNSANVQILRDADHIRRRPGVYIGDINTTGLHHLVYELIYNSVDEALAGFCKNIQVHIYVDGSVSVKDDGRGIPVDIHPQAKKPTLEVVLTTVGAGGKFDKGAYKVSAGLHGMGAKAVTALSAWVEAEVRRGGRTYVQEYERGKATTDLKILVSQLVPVPVSNSNLIIRSSKILISNTIPLKIVCVNLPSSIKACLLP